MLSCQCNVLGTALPNRGLLSGGCFKAERQAIQARVANRSRKPNLGEASTSLHPNTWVFVCAFACFF